MTTALIESGSRLAARSLAWALWLSGWLVLGELGRRFTPLWVGGLGPLALWLLTITLGARFTRSAPWTAPVLVTLLALSAAATAAALACLGVGGGGVAVLAAAMSWGVLVVATAQAVRAIGAEDRHSRPEPLSALLGALLAWVAASHDAPAIASTAVVALCGAGLVALLHGSWRIQPLRFDRPGGSMSVDWSCLPQTHSDWIIRSARFSMLPMMASLAYMTDWCAAAGLTDRSSAIGAHLAAMLLPPCALWLLDLRLNKPIWLAVPMGASVALLLATPGVLGWMAMSMCQSVAWGLACTMQETGQVPAGAGGMRRGMAEALVAPISVCALGGIAAAFGPMPVVSAQAGLGAVALAAALASSLRWEQATARRRA